MHLDNHMVADYPHVYALAGSPPAAREVAELFLQTAAMDAFFPQRPQSTVYYFASPAACMGLHPRSTLCEAANKLGLWLRLPASLTEDIEDMHLGHAAFVPDLATLMLGESEMEGCMELCMSLYDLMRDSKDYHVRAFVRKRLDRSIVMRLGIVHAMKDRAMKDAMLAYYNANREELVVRE
ncbi:hypothetical protein OEZ86_009170 [Tetradesmus obliquus]|nr:hypothetical protein OEZ86_009170 [Tetradesmus obliquus]